MPIANCILSPVVPQAVNHSAHLIEIWGKYSGLDTSEMTITVVNGEAQFGKKYSAICSLYLPTVWSPRSVGLLQIGLSRTLSDYYGLELNKIIVMTSLIESGYVVEDGNEITW